MEEKDHGGPQPLTPAVSTWTAIAEIAGRLDLLVAHLASPALLRRVGRDDLVSDIVIRLIESDSARDLRADDLWRFARTVARNTIVDAARKARHMPRRMASMLGPGDSSSTLSMLSGRAANSAGPSSIAAGREASQDLLRSFMDLPPEHRRVIGLRRFEGLSAEEAGARMGRSAAAVHSLFRRALEAWSKAGRDGPARLPGKKPNSPGESLGPDR